MRNPKRGAIRIDGQDISELPAHKVVGLGVAHMPQGRELFADLTVGENLRLGHWSRRDEMDRLEQRMGRMFELFPRLRERRKQEAGTLSGGEQQMLTVSRALMSEPKVLLVDEASLGLAPMLVEQLYEAIAGVNRRDGTSVLLVDQFIHLALKYTSRAYVLEKGEVVVEGESDELLESPDVLAAYLGESLPDQPSSNGKPDDGSAQEVVTTVEGDDVHDSATDPTDAEADATSEEGEHHEPADDVAPETDEGGGYTEGQDAADPPDPPASGDQTVGETERFVATHSVDEILDAVGAGRLDPAEALEAEEAGTSRITLLRPLRAVVAEDSTQSDQS